jgi:hypothetical protein
MKDFTPFTDYVESAKKLFTKIFGEEVFEKVNGQEIIPFDWDGLDITTNEILATSPSIKERFTESYARYRNERDGDVFEEFIGCLFHYGYDQAMNTRYKENKEFYQKLVDQWKNSYDSLSEENKKLKKRLSKYETLESK